MKYSIGFVVIALVVTAMMSFSTLAVASDTGSGSATVVPQLINFTGVAQTPNGKPLTGVVGITFALYTEQQGGAPLWLETQNVQPDSHGNYTVQLGATLPNGLPSQLFTTGEARWVGVQVQGQEEQPRTLLTSVAYAMKAVDAQTIGGLPPTAFVLAAPPVGAAASSATGSAGGTAQPSLGGSGTQDYIPIWTDNNGDLGNSVMYQSGSGSSAMIGINTTTPAATLDINGGSTVRGLLALPAIGTGKANYDSQPIMLTASAWSSKTKLAVAQNFQWQAEPKVNLNGSVSGTLNLLYAFGTNKPAETGLKIANNGNITFASGQTFPGAGTVTSVGSGLGLTGGPITTSGTLAIDTTVVPQLAANNTFTGTQTINNNVTVTASGNTLTASGGTTGVSGTGSNTGVYGYSGSDAGVGVEGYTADSSGYGAGVVGESDGDIGVTGSSGSNSGVAGFSGSGSGVYGNSNTGAGVYGVTGPYPPTANQYYGVAGNNFGSNYGAGVFGLDSTTELESNTGSSWSSVGAGVWGDGGTAENFGVLGTADDHGAVEAANNSSTYYTLWALNHNSSGYPFYAGNAAGNGCSIDPSGDINCTGSKNAVVPIDGGQRKVALSAIESPKNWFEDFGSAQLAGGSVVVTIDPEYAQTVNTEMDYKVFPVPRGECKGLYVANETPSSFEVRELGNGTSNVRFDYRIVALRRNFENIRMADHTNDPDPLEMMAKTGAPFRFDASKIKLPGMRAPSAPHQPPQMRQPVQPPAPAQTPKPVQAPK